MDLSIIIVNYNVKHFLEQCLLSVRRACTGIQAEVFVVDNASTDDSRAYLEKRFTDEQFIWNTTNPGFGKANNQVLPMCRGKYILFLNPDTIISEESLSACLNHFYNDEAIGAIGVRMIDGSGCYLPESKRNLPTPANSFYKVLGIGTQKAGSNKSYYSPLGEHEVGEVQVLAGAFMMLSKKAIEKTAGFDEDFFMYGEDVDLSYRITKSGLKNVYVGNVSIIHFKGESIDRYDNAYLNNFYGAMSLFVAKHYGKKMFSSFVLKAGIALAKTKAKLSPPKKQLETTMASKTFFAGAKSDIAILRLHLTDDVETPIEFECNNDTTAGVLLQVIYDSKAGLVFFAAGALSNSTIIETMAKAGAAYKFFIHQSGSNSVVGSSDKTAKGSVFAL